MRLGYYVLVIESLIIKFWFSSIECDVRKCIMQCHFGVLAGASLSASVPCSSYNESMASFGEIAGQTRNISPLDWRAVHRSILDRREKQSDPTDRQDIFTSREGADMEIWSVKKRRAAPIWPWSRLIRPRRENEIVSCHWSESQKLRHIWPGFRPKAHYEAQSYHGRRRNIYTLTLGSIESTQSLRVISWRV